MVEGFQWKKNLWKEMFMCGQADTIEKALITFFLNEWPRVLFSC